jgi:hypothetical protein
MSSLRCALRWALAGGVLAGCGSDGDISIGAERVDAATPSNDALTDAPVIPPDAPAPDAPLGPRVCMTTMECVGACPPGARACVCATTPMGLRCVPTCMMTPECPPGPMGGMLFCRSGLCLP